MAQLPLKLNSSFYIGHTINNHGYRHSFGESISCKPSPNLPRMSTFSHWPSFRAVISKGKTEANTWSTRQKFAACFMRSPSAVFNNYTEANGGITIERDSAASLQTIKTTTTSENDRDEIKWDLFGDDTLSSSSNAVSDLIEHAIMGSGNGVIKHKVGDMIDLTVSNMAVGLLSTMAIGIENADNRAIKSSVSALDFGWQDGETEYGEKISHEGIQYLENSSKGDIKAVTDMEIKDAGSDLENSSKGDIKAVTDMEIKDAGSDVENSSKGDIKAVIDMEIKDAGSDVEKAKYATSDMENDSRASDGVFELDTSKTSSSDASQCNLMKTRMETEQNGLGPVKKGYVITSALGGRSHLFVAKRLKASAKRRLQVLFNLNKRKTKNKVILRAAIMHEGGDKRFWSKPILRGKKCREIGIEESYS